MTPTGVEHLDFIQGLSGTGQSLRTDHMVNGGRLAEMLVSGRTLCNSPIAASVTRPGKFSECNLLNPVNAFNPALVTSVPPRCRDCNCVSPANSLRPASVTGLRSRFRYSNCLSSD